MYKYLDYFTYKIKFERKNNLQKVLICKFPQNISQKKANNYLEFNFISYICKRKQRGKI